MASPEFVAFQARLAAQPPPPPLADLPEQRARIDATMGALPLAEGITAEEVDAGGVPAIVCRPPAGADPVTFVYFHGGGYRLGSALAYRAYGSHLAARCRARVVLVDYRLAPEHPFPAAVEDAAGAYRWALDQAGSPQRVVIGGDSAGGGLAAALLLWAADRGLPRPAGAVLCSPWADLTNSSPTFDTHAESDKLFSKESADTAAGLYLAGHAPSDPLASPLLGDWTGAPPVLIQVGDTEVLLDDANRLAKIATAAGVDVELHVYPDMPHVWQLSYPAFPEAVEALDEISAFIQRTAGH